MATVGQRRGIVSRSGSQRRIIPQPSNTKPVRKFRFGTTFRQSFRELKKIR